MDRNELKKTAIDSMSACGRLMSEGNYAEAKRLAEKAWNCYFELQKTRIDDEDFTDLIYAARGYYYDCENNLRLAAEEQAKREAAKLDEEYAKLREMADNGLAGCTSSALSAAIEYLQPKHWDYFAKHEINFSEIAGKLLNVALNDKYSFVRGIAAITASQMYRQPLHGICDIDKSLYYARYAVTQLADQEGMLDQAYKEVIYAACCKGDVELANEYARIARDNGLDMGVFDEIARYGFRHEEKWAQEIEDQIYADGCWQGMLMHGQGLLSNWLEAANDPDRCNGPEVTKLLEDLMDYVRGPLSKYADDHFGKEGGYSCAALAVYVQFLQSWEETLNDEHLMGFAQKGADAYVPWALYYLGAIYDVAANMIAQNNAEDERIPDLRRKAFHNYAIGAGLGNRGCILPYLDMLKEAPEKNAEFIERYTVIARQLDVKVD